MKKKKPLFFAAAFILMFFIFISLPTFTVSAAIPSNAIHIKTEDDLELLRGEEQTEGKYYVLDNDITLTKEWIPIGEITNIVPDGGWYNWDFINDFRGTLDGQGYTINNLYVLSSSNLEQAGLFGMIDTDNVEIKNLGINIASQGITANGSVFGDAGGLIGRGDSKNLTITNCYVNGNVSSNDTAGGLIGVSCSENLFISSCYATGNIIISTDDPHSTGLGGLIGALEVNKGRITNCYATGNISAFCSFSRTGGLLGSDSGSSDLSFLNCYATGNILSDANANTSYAGGFIGYDDDYWGNAVINNCYRLSTQTITGKIINPNGLELTDNQMKTKSSFTNWDFNNIWTFESGINNDYPVLQMNDSIIDINPNQLMLTADYSKEIISITESGGTPSDLSLYSYVIEIGGRIKTIEPLYSDTLNISSILPKKQGKDVKITIVKATAAPDYSRKDLGMYYYTDIMSNTLLLLVRAEKINKKDFEIDYINEVIKGSEIYDYKTSIGTWEKITLNGSSNLSISNYRMGGIIEIRKSATSANAASPSIKIKIKARQKTPSAKKISINKDVFKGINEKMEYSTDGIIWKDCSKDLSTSGFSTGLIYFRMKATERAMKSSPIDYSYVSPSP